MIFSILRWCESEIYSVDTTLRLLNLDLFLGLVMCGVTLSHDAMQWP